MKTIFFVLVLLSSNAFADIEGKWTGFGEWTFGGTGTSCFMFMTFKETKTTILREDGYFDCGVVGLDITRAEFEKSGTNLLNDKGEIVGSYVGNVITLSEDYEDDVKVNSTIEVDGLHIDYNEVWIGSNQQEIYQINGRMFTSRY
jgi:hypothetical protein